MMSDHRRRSVEYFSEGGEHIFLFQFQIMFPNGVSYHELFQARQMGLNLKSGIHTYFIV